MAKYGTSDYQLAKYLDRQEIEHALNGEIRAAETKDGNFVYKKASKKECNKVIMENFDAVVYEAIDALRAGRALEKALRGNRELSENDMAKFKEKSAVFLSEDEQGIYYTEVFNNGR